MSTKTETQKDKKQGTAAAKKDQSNGTKQDESKDEKSNGAKSSNAKKESSAMNMKQSDYEMFFYEDLKDIYWVEKTLTKKLPKIASHAHHDELRAAIEGHLEETKQQQANLEEVFEKLGKKATSKKCEAMEGILSEGEELIEEHKDDAFLCDISIILSSQKVEHYEITAYGNLAVMAKKLGHKEVVSLLEENLKQEKAADGKLSKVFESIHKGVQFEESK